MTGTIELSVFFFFWPCIGTPNNAVLLENDLDALGSKLGVFMGYLC